MGNKCFGGAQRYDAAALPRHDDSFDELPCTQDEKEFMLLSHSNKIANAYVGKDPGDYSWGNRRTSSTDSHADTAERSTTSLSSDGSRDEGSTSPTIIFTSSMEGKPPVLRTALSLDTEIDARKQRRAVAWVKGASMDGSKFERDCAEADESNH